MKKIISIILLAMLITSSFVSCSNDTASENDNASEGTTANTEIANEPEEEKDSLAIKNFSLYFSSHSASIQAPLQRPTE